MTEFSEDPFRHGITNDLVNRISPSVGLMTVSWGFIEQSMAAIIEFTSNEVAKKEINVERPKFYDPKRKYLIKIFKTVEALSSYKNHVNGLFEDMDKLSKVRHLLTHGTLNQFNPDTDTVIISKVNPEKDEPQYVIESQEILVPVILEAGARAEKLATVWGELASKISDQFPND